jgi:hypothetical protein
MYFTQLPEYRPYIDALRNVLEGNPVSSLDDIRMQCHQNLLSARPGFTFSKQNGTAEYGLRLMTTSLAELKILQGSSPNEVYPKEESRELSRKFLKQVVELSDMLN